GAVEEDPERAGVPLAPVALAHLAAVGLEPADVLDAGTVDRPAQEPAPPPEDRVAVAQRDQLGGERQQVLVGRLPVEPGDLAVLAIGVVVAALGAADLVAPQEHRDALR